MTNRQRVFSLIDAQFASKTLIERIEIRLIQLDKLPVSADAIDMLERKGARNSLIEKRSQALSKLGLFMDTQV